MKKILFMMTAVLLGAFITSCSSEDDGLNTDELSDFLEDIVSQHSDNVDVSLLTGAWTEVGYADFVDGVAVERGQNEEYAQYRFNITDEKRLTQYVTQNGSHRVKAVREYEYNPETRRFEIVDDVLSVNMPFVIDYLSEEYMTLTFHGPFGCTVKRILRRVAEDESALWEDAYKPEIRGSIADYGFYLGADKDWRLMDGFEPFSASRFQEIIVGHPLQCVEKHGILKDGRISEFLKPLEFDYLFGDTSLKEIMSKDFVTPWVESEYPYTYEESNNKVCGPHMLTILSYDEEKDQVLAILRPYNWFVIYQRASMEWWAGMEALCGKE